MIEQPLIDIQHLGIEFSIREGAFRALDDVNVSFPKGKISAIIGESGCGKSTMANAILGIFPPNTRIISGSKIQFAGKNLLELNSEEIRAFRWKKASMVFQAAMSSLNPTIRIEEQLLDVIFDHEPIEDWKGALEKVRSLLHLVRLDPEKILNSYPHQISGGMRQRAIIAMALTLDPELVLLDEPTTALDVITQHYIFEILHRLHKKLNVTMILITHDIELAMKIADLIIVMYGGEVLEIIPAEEMKKKPAHPYSVGLLEALPRMTGEKIEMRAIPGFPPNLLQKPGGCIFFPRCRMAKELCKETKPGRYDLSENWKSACHFSGGRNPHETHRGNVPCRSGLPRK